MPKFISLKWRQIGNTSTSWPMALIVLLALAAHANRLSGQTASDASTPAAPVVDSSWADSWPDVDLNLLVTDKHGAPQKIDEHTFQLFEDGAERPLHFPDPADSPVSLALLIDSSGSIFKRKPEILAAVKTIIQALPADSEVMGVLFAQDAYIDLPFTPVSQVDYSFLDRLQAYGPTALWDAVVATENHIVSHAKYGRRALVILSDGEENASRVIEDKILRSIGQPGSPTIYPCRVQDTRKSLDAHAESFRGHRILKLLAKKGGGIVFELDPDPASAAAQIVAAIRSQYGVQFTAADPSRNGKAHKLELRLPVKDMEVHGPTAYYAPEK